ncbi:hypothetical protein [Tardiphaga sp. 768_D3_N2_1]|uniref:hypothetical protein n=1 Tax=Tardiphaga sp. 768_D3_N2_1 TaxID=3240783 RepID=UPI003F8C099E
MAKGQIAMIDYERGAGVIARDDGEPDLCFRFVDLGGANIAAPGARVIFESIRSLRSGKLRAVNVNVVT